MPPKLKDDRRFLEAIRKIDEENARDPNKITLHERAEPRELIYSQWLTDWVLRLRPDASESLRLAARCQHLCRWEIPRDLYPRDRAGYLRWRAGLKQFHAERAGAILGKAGYPAEEITRVQNLILKKNFPQDPEARVLEDALCLVFLEHQLGELALKNPEDKVINALLKSWKKMSPQGQAEALRLRLGEKETGLLRKALKEQVGESRQAGSDL